MPLLEGGKHQAEGGKNPAGEGNHLLEDSMQEGKCSC